jgi:hypothetical protein
MDRKIQDGIGALVTHTHHEMAIIGAGWSDLFAREAMVPGLLTFGSSKEKQYGGRYCRNGRCWI